MIREIVGKLWDVMIDQIVLHILTRDEPATQLRELSAEEKSKELISRKFIPARVNVNFIRC